MTRIASALLLLTLTAGLTSADPTTRPAATAYPLTTDVVTGVTLDDVPVVETIDGREVRFAQAVNATAFKAGGEAMHKQMDYQIVAATKDAYPTDVCVVGDEKLGSMGDPVMYVHRPTNQLVQFCCKACIKSFNATPDKYLAKLAAK